MADKDLEKKIAEAKANGYTDEEIQAYLNPQPVPVQEPKDRSEEYIGTAEFGAGKAAQLAGEVALGYGAYRGLKNVAQNFGRGPTAPVPPPAAPTPPAPTTFTGGANPAWDEALRKPYNPAAPQGAPQTPPVGGPAAQQGSTFLQRFGQQLGEMRQAVAPVVEQVATKAAPFARGATAIGGMVMPGNVGQNYGAYFPQKGPMRGMEINPQTGRPWTQQELATYNAMNQ